ncbi:PIN domain-containing protein [Cytobacillus gottheilii]|uniref:PIN domain-containing protein n=1 Tax=Cytobacillus gottheilii TaxID=859144 RepID=UPI0009BA8AE3|nr:PIN domain-containing protein [Cytobacillus gottheilii]
MLLQLNQILIEPFLGSKDNNDDRILASLITLLRKHPNNYVNLVNEDINLHNKAEYANVPFVEVNSGK